MRKGFTLTLTTLAVALMTSSVYAYGPTVGGIPDVWITEKTAAGTMDDPQYIFRYSDAIVLADYVTPGVEEGNGSTSATLEWTWALRYSTFDGGFSFVTNATTVNWLDSTDVHYSITGEDATNVQPNKPTFDVSGDSFAPSSWVSEVNTTWTNKANLADSGALTFQNIRLNPTIVGNPSPTADTVNPQLPAGVLDCQEATIFVTDGATTPGFDMVQLVTLMSDATVDKDLLSGGGPVYEMVEDYRTSTPTSEWSLISTGLSVAAGLDLNRGATTASNNGTGTILATFPLVNNKGTSSTDPFFPVVLLTKEGVAVTSDKIYRITARAQSSNTDATVNPSIRVDLNGRTSVGEGFGELSSKSTISSSPVSGTPVYVKGFLWPITDGAVQSFVVMWDTTDTVGGTITLDNMAVEAFDPTKLAGGSVLYDGGTGAAAGIATSGANSFLSAPVAFLTGTPNVTMTATPSTGGALTLAFTGQYGSADGVGVWANFSDGTFTTPAFTGKKLCVLKAMVLTTSNDTARVPDFHMALQIINGNERAGMLIDRFFVSGVKQNDDSDVSNVARPYYVIAEVKPETAYAVEMYALVTADDQTNGNLTVERLTATLYDLPAETIVQP